jgi:curved DNA-binding protein CbpA
MKDYYYILGVKSNSTEKEIKSAYRKLSLKFHPDKNEGDKFFEERFKEINEAYEILGDIQKRKEYDSNSQNKTEKQYSYNQEPSEPEIVFFRVNKSSIKKGEILEVSWETKFANSIKILPFGVLEASGTKRFKINGDDSFQCKILASNGNKVVSKEISITVIKIQPNPTAPIILTFESDKVIADEGGFIELTWQTTNATRVEIEGLGVVPLSGSAKFNTKLKVDFNRPVSLTARNEFGSVSKSIKIYKRETQPVDESNYSFLWILALALVIMIVVAGIKSEPKATTTIPDDTAFAVDTTMAVDTTAFVDTASTDSDNFTNDLANSQIESPYIGNQLQDGDSPLTSCFGKGIYSGNATLRIQNGGNSDAIVCLFSYKNDRTIRNEYVRKNSNFTMSNIAQGEYKIRVFYGNDWNPNLINTCGTKGSFESDVSFSIFDGTEYFEDDEKGYTSATITLYAVASGNASSSPIDQSQFFKK